MASFCLATGLTPNEYRALTIVEMQAFVSAVTANGNSKLQVPR
jgi:hypothetical protein